MLIAAIVTFCVLLFVVALLFPRISRKVEAEGDAPLDAGQRAAAHAPGGLSRWLQKAFRSSRKAVHKSGLTDRRTRFKLPF